MFFRGGTNTVIVKICMRQGSRLMGLQLCSTLNSQFITEDFSVNCAKVQKYWHNEVYIFEILFISMDTVVKCSDFHFCKTGMFICLNNSPV